MRFIKIKWKSQSVMNKRKKASEEFPILKLIPSKSDTIDDSKVSCSTKFDELIDLACDIKSKLIYKNDVDSQFLATSVDKVIHIVSRYRDVSKPQPFSFPRSKFPESVLWMSFEFDQDVEDTSYENMTSEDHFDCIPPSLVNEISRVEFPKKTVYPEQQVLESVEPDNPTVSRLADFVVTAFNDACKMHVKKGEDNNLHDFEIMECKIQNNSSDDLFYMTIEAIEEGYLGVYETQVFCPSGHDPSLIKFILTDRIPTGTKATAISLFSCVRSLCETLKIDIKEKQRKLQRILNATKGPHRGTAWALLDLLDEVSDATMEGLLKVFSLGLRLLFPPNCNRTTNPDVWCHPDISWMVPRGNGAPCRGYDYSRPLQTI